MLNKIIWSLATTLLIISGIYFTIDLKGVQFNIKRMIKSLNTKEKTKISPLQTLMLSVSAKIGVGSIAGIALCIYIGGSGSLFWLWISAFITAPNAFIESLFGAKYKKKTKEGYVGGPAYYIKQGLNNKKLSFLYATFVIILYILCFSSIQSNTIATSIFHSYHVNKYITGTIIVVISAFAIFKNMQHLIKMISYMVPIMCATYIAIGMYIIFKDISSMKEVLNTIFLSAFNIKSMSTGILSTIIIGVQRGVFSNEAGIGTGAIASSSSDTKNYINQGYVQILGVYFTSLVICSISAFLILLSPYQDFITTKNVNGIELSLFALKYHLGSFGEFFLIFSIFLFAFSTIVAGYYYGESSLRFLFKNIKKSSIILFKLLLLVILFYGSISHASVLWNISDFIIGLLAIINIYSCIKLYIKQKL